MRADGSRSVALPETVTAVAHPNIALVKYWGKRDDELILPLTSSISLTLDVAPTTTTVTLDADADRDSFVLNGVEQEPGAVARFLGLVRDRAGAGARAGESLPYAHVESVNEIPTGAGLASSASGFAALATAAQAVYGLDLGTRDLSRLARRGSGSASRSIFDGFAIWHSGTDDESSFAEQLTDVRLDLSLILVVLRAEAKSVSSREAMRRTVLTSPFMDGWVTDTRRAVIDMRRALESGDLPVVGEIAETSALRMHSTMLSAVPPVRYFNADTLRVLDWVADARKRGLAVYATMDAGPNVKLLVATADRDRVHAALLEDLSVGLDEPLHTIVAGAGRGARIMGSTEHAAEALAPTVVR